MELSSRVAPTVAGRVLDAAWQTAPLHLHGARLKSLVTGAGGGQLLYDDLAVTRRSADVTRDADGILVFLRDRDDDSVWSAGLQPTGVLPQVYDVDFSPSRATIRRQEGDLQTEMSVRVDAERDVELRRISLTNVGSAPRRIEVTSYLEWVLQEGAADEAHPAFSKIFVETRIDPRRRLVVARRRARDPEQRTLVGAHWLISDDEELDCPIEFETSRLAFLGRGGSLRNPAALCARGPLSAAEGPVLDPIASLRRAFFLEAGESAVITLATTARPDLDHLLSVVDGLSSAEADRIFAAPFARATAGPVDSERIDGEPLHRRVDPPHAARHSRIAAFHRLDGEPSDAGEAESTRTSTETEAPLEFDNGWGGFAPSGKEYVIRLRPDGRGGLRLPPLPWTHVVANPVAGFIATERGAGCTWTVNSRENRLTHWSNDPVCDSPSEALYLRERDRRAYWSPTPGPAGASVVHEVRYGFGYAQYRQTSAQLCQRLEMFVPPQDAVKLMQLELENLTAVPRSLELFFYAHWALGNGALAQARGVRVWWDAESQCLCAINAERHLAQRVAFAKIVLPDANPPATFTADRSEFLGRYGDLAAPAAVVGEQPLSGASGVVRDPCAAICVPLAVAPAAKARCWVVLGEADDLADARRLASQYSSASAVEAASRDSRDFWKQTLSGVEVETPSKALDFMVNGWLPYQNLSCRMWGRSAFYQSGGAYGFRDQLQDAAALVHLSPEITRRQLLRHAASQFVEGDVLHWWHPPDSRGIRTRFADDLLWLPLLAAEYCQTTGDDALWDEQAPFLTGPDLRPDEAERFLVPRPSGQTGSIYDHACRAIDRSLHVGRHGLPLMGCGDWNDGMNRVGRRGLGESVWMGFFLYVVLEAIIPVCAARGDQRRVERYREHQARLREALNGPGWDGQWFRRAYFDDGAALGGAESEECQIDLLVQAWAVLSGVGDADKRRQAMAAAEDRLVSRHAQLIRLLDPPFDRMARDPGYIKGYLPGIRENGGQYTHAALWFIRALAEMRRGARAVELLEMVNPINHSRTPEEVAVYQGEPYVVAADVYSTPPHAGRAGWTWYTGSAGWMWRVAVESVLGCRLHRGRELAIDPRIAPSWRKCRVIYRLPGGPTSYAITIENPDARESEVREAFLDGAPVPILNGAARVPVVADGRSHDVVIRL